MLLCCKQNKLAFLIFQDLFIASFINLNEKRLIPLVVDSNLCGFGCMILHASVWLRYMYRSKFCIHTHTRTWPIVRQSTQHPIRMYVRSLAGRHECAVARE